ncbi:MAG: carbohydrate porin [Gammaproteobacteria bacterium]|nr:carbohydrate porin [Gammaproteobacteria bacterium]
MKKQISKKRFVLSGLALSLAISLSANAESIWSQDNLTGSWGGARTNLENKGYGFEFAYVTDVMSNLSGGAAKGTERLDNVDLVFNLDAGKAFGMNGVSASFYFIGNTGGSPTDHVGDMQGVSNIDADNTFKLYEAWIETNFLDDALSFRLGLYDLNSEFDVMETAGLFLNSSHGIGPDFAQSGENGPSIFPTTSLGFRAVYKLTPTMYAQGVVLDGVAGDPNNPNGTQVKLGANDGLLVSGEMGFATDPEDKGTAYTKFAVGSWYYTQSMATNSLGSAITPQNNSGYYAVAERKLFSESGSGEQGLSGFARFGMANDSLNAIDYYYSVGFVYSGLIPGRNKDQFGFAVANAHTSQLVYDALSASSFNPSGQETNIEVTYRLELTPWMVVQPDLQYVVTPSARQSIANALVVGSRFELVF